MGHSVKVEQCSFSQGPSVLIGSNFIPFEFVMSSCSILAGVFSHVSVRTDVPVSFSSLAMPFRSAND